jgi:hypothetical protein
LRRVVFGALKSITATSPIDIVERLGNRTNEGFDEFVTVPA